MPRVCALLPPPPPWRRRPCIPISIVVNHKFIRPSVIYMLGDFSLIQNEQPILAQPNFHTLYKVASAHPSMNYFQSLYVNFPENFSHFLFGTIFKSVNFFFETLVICCSTLVITLLKSDVTSRDHVVRCRGSQECGSRFVNFACKLHWRWHGPSHNSEIYNIVFMRSSNV